MDEKEIKDKVDEVFNETRLISTPVEIISMASFYGFSVYELEMDRNTSGMIIVNDGPIKAFHTDKIIAVNSAHPSTRKRFTVAHELGHYILQDRPKKCFAHRDSDENYDSQERDADSFASALLMPEDDIQGFVKSYRKSVIDDEASVLISRVAQKYNVSGKAAQVRLKKLGII